MSKLPQQMEEEAEMHDRVAKSLRNAARLMREMEHRQEVMPLALESVRNKPKNKKSAAAMVRAVVAKMAGEFTIADVAKVIKAEFPTTEITHKRISFLLWKMTKKGKLRIITQGSAHVEGVFAK
jgi:hypothetical protein